MPKHWTVRKAGANKTRVESPLGSISRVKGHFGRYRRGEHRSPKRASVIRNFNPQRRGKGGKELNQRYNQASVPALGMHTIPYSRSGLIILHLQSTLRSREVQRVPALPVTKGQNMYSPTYIRYPE